MLTQEDFDKIDSLIVSRVTDIIGVVIDQLRKEDILPMKRDIAVLKNDVSVLKQDTSLIKEDLRSFKSYTAKQFEIQDEKIQTLAERIT